MPLLPLQNSHTVGEVERELKALMIDLYEKHLKEQADEINVYGMPHLGSFKLIERLTAQDGLVVLRQNSEDALRYLYKAWRGRNPERGLHFLKTYLQVLWGTGNYNVNQMWQKKLLPYPVGLKTEGDINWAGESFDDYFLTSRITVDVETDTIPDNIIKAIMSTVPARIIVKPRAFRKSESTMSVMGAGYSSMVLRANGEGIANIPFSEGGINIAGVSGASTLFYGGGVGI